MGYRSDNRRRQSIGGCSHAKTNSASHLAPQGDDRPILDTLCPRRSTLAREPGRYQCPELQAAIAVDAFLNQFRSFIQDDGRHNVWIASKSGSEMLIYDRHNVIYAYGPVDAFREVLATEGLKEVPSVRFPSPHSHHYHQSLDSEEERLLQYWNWHRSPLKESDDE
jgi:hypothetical protein